MPLNITRRDIEEAHRYARDAMSRVRDVQDSGERVVGQVTQTLEISAGAIGMGILTGYFGPSLNLAGSPVPLDLCIGVAGHLLGFAGIAGANANHLHNIADGVLASWMAKIGVGLGTDMRMNKQTKPSTGGYLGAAAVPAAFAGPSAAPLNESELAAMAQAVR